MRACARLLVLSVVLALSACGSSGRGEPDESGGGGGSAPLVVGTVVDAGTGALVSGATLEGPGGARTKSDARGHFELVGLDAGAQGPLVAKTSDGKAGQVELRPLDAGTLQVVIHVRKVPEGN